MSYNLKLYVIFNSNLLSSNIKGLINEQYMDFRQNIKIYQPQPQIPNNFTPQIPNPKFFNTSNPPPPPITGIAKSQLSTGIDCARLRDVIHKSTGLQTSPLCLLREPVNQMLWHLIDRQVLTARQRIGLDGVYCEEAMFDGRWRSILWGGNFWLVLTEYIVRRQCLMGVDGVYYEEAMFDWCWRSILWGGNVWLVLTEYVMRRQCLIGVDGRSLMLALTERYWRVIGNIGLRCGMFTSTNSNKQTTSMDEALVQFFGTRQSRPCDSLIMPPFHTDHESHESPRIDKC